MTDAFALTHAPIDAPVVDRWAIFSPCRTWRYALARVWIRSKPWALFVLQNPSDADGDRDDLTAAKCQGFARRLGCGGVVIVNVEACVATDPADLIAARKLGIDTVGPENERHVTNEFIRADDTAAPIIAGCGASCVGPAAEEMRARLIERGAMCLGYTRDGHPRHPSRLSYATPLEPLR